jgi:hypothetical protein
MADNKIQTEHPLYRKWSDRWKYAWAHYQVSDVLDDIDKAAFHGTTTNIRTAAARDRGAATHYESRFLHRHAQAEDWDAYKERCRITDVTPLYPTAIDTLRGVFFAVEHDAARVFQKEGADGLGDENDPETPIGRIWHNVDGTGLNYRGLWKRLTTRLIALSGGRQHGAVILVDGIPKNKKGEQVGEATAKMIDPLDVINWREEDGRWVECVVKEEVDARTSIMDDAEPETQYVHYELDGFTRYVPNADGDEYEAEAKMPYGPGGFRYRDETGRECLPIFPVTLALERPVGYAAARKANAILNQESTRDWLLWAANFIRLLFDHNEAEWSPDEVSDKLKSGWSILPGVNHKYINPSSESAKLASEVLKDKVRAFFDTVFQQYNDAAKERTATEIKVEQRDLEAFMVLLRDTVDEAENHVLYLWEQVYFPGQKDKWGQASVERSDNFTPADMEAVTERAMRRFFGVTSLAEVVDVETLFGVVKDIVEYEGQVVEGKREEALREAVQAYKDRGSQEGVFGTPQDAIARLRARRENGQPQTEAV